MKYLFLISIFFIINAYSSNIDNKETAEKYFDKAKKSKNKLIAINLYKKSCELGLSTGCYNQYFLDKLNYKPLIKSCDLNFAQGCLETGIYYEKIKNKTKSMNYYKKGCKLNNAQSCYNSGVINYKNYNDKKAVIFFKKSCKLGDKSACNILKKI